MRLSALLLALLATSAAAACPNQSEVFSCTINGKPVQLCHWKGALIYNFGPEDQPELSLAEPLETVAYTPWPGIGMDIWESVAFPNAGYVYEVWSSVTRNPESTAPLEAGVNVLQGESLVAQLRCDPGTPSTPLSVISDLKASIGQCWDGGTQTWSTICN
jgi:hypothetical protein